jgi:hypothetical protein
MGKKIKASSLKNERTHLVKSSDRYYYTGYLLFLLVSVRPCMALKRGAIIAPQYQI